MRRILAIISAFLLALLITGGVLVYRTGDFSLQSATESVKNLFVGSESTELPIITEETVQEEEEENLSYDERIEKGDYFFERGFLTFASNEYVKAANLEPNRALPYVKLVETHFELRNYKKALSNAEQALKLDPNHLETRFKVILSHIKVSEFDMAMSLLEEYPVTQIADARVLYYKALLYAQDANHEEAKKLLKQARVASNDAELNANIAIMLDAYEEFSFTQAAEELYLSELLARGFNKVGEYEIAINLLRDVLKERGDLRDGWILFGFAYLNLEKYQFALTAFERAYSLDSEWPTTQYFLGITHKELGHFDDSIVYFNYALSNDFEPSVVIHNHLSDLYFETEEFEKAASSYEQVLEVNQSDVNAYIKPVWLYLDFIKDPKKALELSETAALAFPESAMSYNLLGWSYMNLDQHKEAENHLKKAIEIDPSLPAAHYNLGKLYEKLNKTELALKSYQSAHGLDENGSIGKMAASDYNELLKESLSN